MAKVEKKSKAAERCAQAIAAYISAVRNPAGTIKFTYEVYKEMVEALKGLK